MATVIRLQRHGRRHFPFYKIVVTDRRAPRDGRFIENLGTYNPNTHPATIELNFERALHWVNVGAQPSEHRAEHPQQGRCDADETPTGRRTKGRFF